MKNFRKLKKEHGIYPAINFLGLFQIPIHIVNFSFINEVARNSEHPMHQYFVNGGDFWFPNLAIADPTGALPIINATIALLNMKMVFGAMGEQAEKMIGPYKNYVLMMPLTAIPLQMYFPAAFNLYWVIVGGFQLTTMTLLKMPIVLRMLKIK